MSLELLTLILFVSVFALFFLGLPVAFSLFGVAVIGFLLLSGPVALVSIFFSAFNIYMKAFLLVALPLFIFMGHILERSGIAEALFATIRGWIGRVPGGLAMGTVLICTVMAAMVGIIGAGVVTMSIVALPVMLSYKYNQRLTMGAIMAGGALGALIPPSIVMLIYAQIAGLSVGKLFAGGIIPGLILSGLYITSIAIRCARKPELGPPVPLEERYTWREKFVSLRGVILPVLLVVAVLGSIFGGIATPTEAAAVGAFGALICAAIYRRFSWTMLKEATLRTFTIFSMLFWIIIGATAFSRFFMSMGGIHLVEGLLVGGEVNPWVVLIAMQVSIMLLGMILDEWVIVMIAAPIYIPVIVSLGFDPLWFGILFMINIQMAVLTPPFGYALFYMRAVTLKEGIPMKDIWWAVLPFVPLQATGLALVMAFPQLALWLPGIIFG